jgi:hypothetical protein
VLSADDDFTVGSHNRFSFIGANGPLDGLKMAQRQRQGSQTQPHLDPDWL